MRRWILICAMFTLGSGGLRAQDAPAPAAQIPPGNPVTVVGDIEVREFPAMTAATVMEEAASYLPETGYAASTEGLELARERMLVRGYEKLARWMKNGGNPMGPTFIIFYADPRRVPTAQLRFKIGYPASGNAKGQDSVKIEELPPMTAAVARFTGPFRDAGVIWDTLSVWMRERGFAPAGPPMEVYLRGMYDNADPAGNFAELRWPVRPVDGTVPREPVLPARR